MAHHALTDLVDLTAEQRTVLETIEQDETLCASLYLTGGTLLKALGIVPRHSNDLDLFTFPNVDRRAYFLHRQRVGELLRNAFPADDVRPTEEGYLHAPSGMVIDIVADAIPAIDAMAAFGKLQTAGPRDVAAGKASALCSRDELKDYIDIAFLTHRHRWALRDLEAMAEQKFGLGTITEEKLLAELIAKRDAFTIPDSVFLRDGDEHRRLVQRQVANLIEHTTL